MWHIKPSVKPGLAHTAARRMLQTGELYRDLGSNDFTCQDPGRTAKRLIRQLEALGHRLALEPREVGA